MSSQDQNTPVYVTISALDAGHLTLPESLFVTDADPNKRSTVPSLSFLIQHPSTSLGSPSRTTTNLVFDLGVKRDITGYTASQLEHVANRQPVITRPDCADSLRFGALEKNWEDVSQSQENGENEKRGMLINPETDIDMVILSHVHWDHVGTSSDFPGSTFIVGSGTQHLLRHGAGPLYPAALFNYDELPASRTVELPPVPRDGTGEYEVGPHVPLHTPKPESSQAHEPAAAARWAWKPLGGFKHTLDLFGDGSVIVIDSPGHLYGHVNLLVRISETKYVYLGGDCCHDPRILAGEKGIALYDDGRGGVRSVHVDTGVARKTLDSIAGFVEGMKTVEGGKSVEVEVVVAHDGEWRAKNRHRFWPGSL